MKRFVIEMNEEDVTESMRDSVSRLGLSSEVIARCSTLLILQLHATVMSGVENPFKSIHEINCLENTPSKSRTKAATTYNGKYLKGLWHKHYEGTGIQSLIANIQNQFNFNKKTLGSGLPSLAEEIAENERNGTKKYFEPEDAKRIAHEFVVTNFSRRAKANKITGHWIIYAQHNQQNYYLCLAQHTDDDKEIRRQIDAVCAQEFPFLKDILPSL
ncbi:Uncharacterised protein [Serratia quinivorans]|nr:Uncharacterised protein [Serratia quinivorans]